MAVAVLALTGCTLAAAGTAPSSPAASATPGPIRVVGQTGSGNETTCAQSEVQVVVDDDIPIPLAGCTGELASAPTPLIFIHVGESLLIVGGTGRPLGGVIASGSALAHGVVASGSALQRDASLFTASSVGTSTIRLTRGFTCVDASTGRRADLATCPLLTVTIEN